MMEPSQSGAAAGERTKIYTLQNFYLKSGTQASRNHEFFSKAFLPALSEIHAGPKIVLEALVAPHMPQLALILGFRSLEAFQEVGRELWKQEKLQKAVEALESGPEPPYEHYSVSLLEATDYSPEIVPLTPPPKAPRIFELRTYHSPTWRQLKALHERFAGPEIKIFHRSGVHPLLYSSTVVGPNMPNLTYLIPFDNLAAREKAWAAFGADEEWKKVRAESIAQHGQISSVIQMWLFRAAPYSPVR
jgi:hypothetical protein